MGKPEAQTCDGVVILCVWNVGLGLHVDGVCLGMSSFTLQKKHLVADARKLLIEGRKEEEKKEETKEEKKDKVGQIDAQCGL